VYAARAHICGGGGAAVVAGRRRLTYNGAASTSIQCGQRHANGAVRFSRVGFRRTRFSNECSSVSIVRDDAFGNA